MAGSLNALGITLAVSMGIFITSALDFVFERKAKVRQQRVSLNRVFSQGDSAAEGRSIRTLGSIQSSKLKNAAQSFLVWLIGMVFIRDEEAAQLLKLRSREDSFLKLVYLGACLALVGSILIILMRIYYAIALLAVSLVLLMIFEIRRRAHKEKGRFARELIGFAEGVAAGLGSGLSLLQAFEQGMKSAHGVLLVFCQEVLHEVALGSAIDRAIYLVVQKQKMYSLLNLSISLQVQYRLGGNIKRLFEEYAAQARGKLLFEQSLKAQTAQGRLSAKLVGVVPLSLLVIMNFLMPGYFSYFFSNPTGQFLVVLALFLNLLGFFLVSSLSKVRL